LFLQTQKCAKGEKENEVSRFLAFFKNGGVGSMIASFFEITVLNFATSFSD
jgi:hypothetical protein